jgi:hypothetical protein
VGGTAWRKFEPIAPSKVHGRDYESWEFGGKVAHESVYFLGLAGMGRASRVDIAFDYEVAGEVTATVAMDEIRPHVASLGLTEGVSGEGGINSHYVGSKSSGVRLCIYRKDHEGGEVWKAMGLPPVLRWELRLRERWAADFWSLWARSPESAFAMAAGKVHAMTGARLQDELTEWSRFERPEAFDVSQQVFEFVQQYGALVACLDEAGVDVLALCRESSERRSRMARWRTKARRALIESVGASVLEDCVRRSLAATA